jgi:hypothetical protein
VGYMYLLRSGRVSLVKLDTRIDVRECEWMVGQ